MQNSPYKIFNASAGSGKTYTLAKEYLKIILSSNAYKSYAQILAITFTNKAVNEMKKRILGSLFDFSKTTATENASPMLLSIGKELDLPLLTLQKRAKKTLKEILHNYALFDISTIDKFTHRLIRTFAKDLGLAQNFEVVLDIDILLSEAIARLINKAGSDMQLTKILIDFALEKINDDKSWDISFDLGKIGKLLFEENHTAHLEKLQTKSIANFLELKKIVQERISTTKKELISTAKTILETIDEYAIEHTDFTRASFPKFMVKIAQGIFNGNLKTAWSENFDTNTLYNKSCSEDIKAILDNLHPRFIEMFNKIKDGLYHYSFLNNCYSNIVPLTVLNAIQQEIKELELERNQLPISSFNTIIANEINNQPAPFIYERLGEKYRHYFVDEFQDTSQMQWKNLIPLIGNALDSEDEQGNLGSLLLVGDAKQAIYRWRGGKVEQFINLIDLSANPFVAIPDVENLPVNYRSYKEIIKFNNEFFNSTSSFLNNEAYKQLFIEGNKQEYNTKEGGYVQLTFIDNDKEIDERELYNNEVLKTIREVLQKKFNHKDICILTRDNRHGISLASFLTQNHIPTISSDSLLLQSSPKVEFLINFLKYSLQPKDLEISYSLIYFLATQETNIHNFIYKNLKNLEDLLLKKYGINLQDLKQTSVYDVLEYIIKQFNLVKDSDAYITYLMDEVLKIEQKEGPSTQVFLDYWDKKKEKLSVTAPENVDAVHIMSVHKSKGLEFPIVIFPYANSHIYKEINPKLWLAVKKENFNQFEEVLLNKKQEVVYYSELAANLYGEEQYKLELDAFNVLYVALTRSITALYIISKKDINAKEEHKLAYYSGLFIHFLKEKGLWNSDKSDYYFGDGQYIKKKDDTVKKQENIPYTYTHKENSNFNILTKAGTLWETGKDHAISRGNITHELLSHIISVKDVDNAFLTLINRGDITTEEAIPLKVKIMQIVNHPKLKEYYQEGNNVINERDIITKNGLILRPDRIVFKNNSAIIIDYKTGKTNTTYHRQLNDYATAFISMGYKIKHKIIVYINKEINPEFI